MIEEAKLIRERATLDGFQMWEEYAECLKDFTGLDHKQLDEIGYVGAHVVAAEYKIHGNKTYDNSVVQPIRNAFFGCATIDSRWDKMSKFEIVEPVLDFGSGVGVTLKWLHDELGMTELYAYEPSGVQEEFLRRYAAKLGFKHWNRKMPSHFETVICVNVLEHLPDPAMVLENLRQLGTRVIANCDLSEDETHIAPHEARAEVVRSLIAHNQTWQTEQEIEHYRPNHLERAQW